MHILAVDDDPIILELLEEFVRHIGGHSVVTAESAVDALEILSDQKARPFDCFLLDIQMPGTDGIELCRILRSRADCKTAPILMLTAMSEKSYIDRAFAAGASDYITKPFEIDDLRGRISLVDSLITQRKAERQAAVETGAADLHDADHPEAILEKPELHEPFAVQEVDGVIEHQALENYVSLLSRKKLFGSTVFGFCIRGIQDLYDKTNAFEFNCLVTDVAEAIASSLEDHQFLLSYAGNGVYVCIVERGWHPDPFTMTDRVNLTLHHMGLCYNDGREMNVSVSTGELIRLVWKSGDKAIDALAAAYVSAERESNRYARNLEDFWYARETA